MKRTFSVAIESQTTDNKNVQNKCAKIEANLQKPLLARLGIMNQKFQIIVPSQRHPNKRHVVILNDNLQFECDCGDEWNISPKRNHCTHIGMVIGNMLRDYIKLTLGKDAERVDLTNMDTLLKEFGKTMSIL